MQFLLLASYKNSLLFNFITAEDISIKARIRLTFFESSHFKTKEEEKCNQDKS